MRFYVRTVLGTLIALCALAFFLFGIFQLVRGGSCASGGNYMSTRQCPAGSTEWMFALPPAVIIGLCGLFLVARRGPRPGAPVRPAAQMSFRPADSPYRQAPADDPLARLERLTALRDAGALSEDEFQRAKATIIAQM